MRGHHLKSVALSATAGIVGLAVAAGSASAAPTTAPGAPTVPAGTTAVYLTPTSGNFVNGSGQVVGGWAELGAPTALGFDSVIAPDTTKQEDGGTWTYGDYVNDLSDKVCYSDYQNNNVAHSATSKMVPAGTDQVTRSAGTQANSEEVWPVAGAGVCDTYWDTYS